jgi:DNA-binding NarL/FixJ family response regulator
VAIRVVLADDHPMYRFGLRAILDAAVDVDVVGEAGDGEELLAVLAAQPADVVLTDLSMPRLSGTEVIAALRQREPHLGVLVLTMHADDAPLFAALRAGARGYLLKGADRAEILRAVASVAAGEAVYGADVARRIMDFYTGASDDYRAATFPELTAREREVLELLAAGSRNHEIARRLGVADKTVRNHVSAVLTKLQVSDRAAAVARARDAGLGAAPQPSGRNRPLHEPAPPP